MKKLFFLLLMVGMIISHLAFAQNQDVKYLIPYAKGIDTLVQKAGDKIGSENLVFYEQADQFTRGDAIKGTNIIPFSSHNFKFWLKDVKVREDTLDGSITILSAVIAEDPNVLLASRVEPTGGDEDSPAELPIGLGWMLLMCAVGLAGCVGIFKTLT